MYNNQLLIEDGRDITAKLIYMANTCASLSLTKTLECVKGAHKNSLQGALKVRNINNHVLEAYKEVAGCLSPIA